MHRPFHSLAQLKLALARVVREAGSDAQLALIRAHPELAGKAMIAKALTAESTGEQERAGLTACTAEEFSRLQRLNADYNAKFGFPFILAVRGPRGLGLSRKEIIATFERRLGHHPDFERAECLRNIHRIAEIRLDDKFGASPEIGNQVWDWAEQLAVHSDPGYAERGELTVTYLTDAHQAVARQLLHWMREDCGFDEVGIDAVGNVVGVYHGTDRSAKRLLTGSHYDTVRNGGRYDGRLGILVPMVCVRELRRPGRRLPFGIEVVGFSEEEGQRYKAVFLGSGALIGQFDLPGSTSRMPTAFTCARPCVMRDWIRKDSRSRAMRPDTSALSKFISSRGRCSTASTCRWRRHLDQWRTALRGRDLRHGQPCRYHADGSAP